MAKKYKRIATSLLAALTASFGAGVVAQGRTVIVNDVLLDDIGLAQLDRINCGEPVPDGHYWIDGEQRVWGYAGQPGREPLPDCSADQAQPEDSEGDCESRYTYHEDRMCYCYGVC